MADEGAGAPSQGRRASDGYLFYGVIDLLVFLQGPEFVEGTMLETGWGLVFLVLVATPLAAVAIAPKGVTVTAIQQVYLAGAIGAPASWLRTPVGWSWWPGLIVLAGIGPGLAYVVACADAARRDPRPSLTWGVDHWPVQAALPLAVLTAAAVGWGLAFLLTAYVTAAVRTRRRRL